MRVPLTRQLLCQFIEQLPPSLFPQLSAVCALKECRLFCEYQIGPFVRQAEVRLWRATPKCVCLPWPSCTPRQYVDLAQCPDSVVSFEKTAPAGPPCCGTKASALHASNPKIQIEFFYLKTFSFRKPAALLRRVCKGGEHAFRRGRIVAFNDEGSVCNRSSSSFVKSLLKYCSNSPRLSSGVLKYSAVDDVAYA